MTFLSANLAGRQECPSHRQLRKHSVRSTACGRFEGGHGLPEQASRKLPSTAREPVFVTVVVPFYNLAEFLDEALASVAAQTVRGIETIVVDDGSKPDQAEAARELSAKYGARYVHQPNAGLSAARNKGVSLAAAPYVLPLDADDRIAPTMVEKTLWYLASRPRLGFVWTGIRHFGLRSTLWLRDSFDPYILTMRNLAGVNSLIRKTALEEAGGYDETMTRGYEDWCLWVSMLEKGWRGAPLPEYLFEYRVRPGSMYSHSLKLHDELVEDIRQRHKRLYSPWGQFRLWLEHAARWKAKQALTRLKAAIDTHRTLRRFCATLRRGVSSSRLRGRFCGDVKRAREELAGLSRELGAAGDYARPGAANVLVVLGDEGPGADDVRRTLQSRYDAGLYDFYVVSTAPNGAEMLKQLADVARETYALANFLAPWAWRYFVAYYVRTRKITLVEVAGPRGMAELLSDDMGCTVDVRPFTQTTRANRQQQQPST